MRRLEFAGQRCLVSTVILGLGLPLSLAGCGSSRTESPVAQATAGQASAKSSMDFMRKHVAEKKPTSKYKSKTH